MTTDQQSKAQAFRLLHAAPLMLPNAWDAVSAKILQLAGADAIGTTSAGIAYGNGHADGEHLSWDKVGRKIAAEIVTSVTVPVTVDIESGYGATPDQVAATVTEVIAIGAAGINIEDSIPGMGTLRDTAAAAERIAAARDAAEHVETDLFVNARCDAYFIQPTGSGAFEEVLTRAEAYVVAGADGIFLPGLLDLPTLISITKALTVPVNAMVSPAAPPVADLIAAGVRRFSQGPWAFCAMAAHLERLTTEFVATGAYGHPSDDPPAWHRLNDLIDP